jgi:geranylgeranylglycerol-phosphate geranylgeranyltransferase
VTFIPFILGWLGTAFILLFIITDLSIVIIFYDLYCTKTPEEGRKRIRRLYLLIMFFVVAFLALTIIDA